MAFIGSLLFGLTGVILKLGVQNTSVIFGIFVRALVSIPFLLLFSHFTIGFVIYNVFTNISLLMLMISSSVLLLSADFLFMNILKEKPVGVITPIVSTNPMITAILLIFLGISKFSASLLLWTSLIIVGIMIVTYETDQTSIRDFFDTKALIFGMGISMCWGLKTLVSILILQNKHVTGTMYTTMEIIILGTISSTLFFGKNHSVDNVKSHFINRKSIKLMMLAGIVGWVVGAILVFTAFEKGDPIIINPIIGMNHLFTVIISLILKIETVNKFKVVGIILCIFSSLMIVV